MDICRYEANQRQTGVLEITRIETLHHADKSRTEDYILELLLWLNLMTKQIQAIATRAGLASPIKSSKQVSSWQKCVQPTLTPVNHSSPTRSAEDKRKLRDVSNRKHTLGPSKSQKFESTKVELVKHDRLSKSSGHASTSKSYDFIPVKIRSSGVAVTRGCCDKEKVMDAVDGLGKTVS